MDHLTQELLEKDQEFCVECQKTRYHKNGICLTCVRKSKVIYINNDEDNNYYSRFDEEPQIKENIGCFNHIRKYIVKLLRKHVR